MEILMLILLLANLVLLAILTVKQLQRGKENDALVSQLREELQKSGQETVGQTKQSLELFQAELGRQGQESTTKTQQAVVTAMGSMGQTMSANLKVLGDSLGANVQGMSENMQRSIGTMKTVLEENQNKAAAAQAERLETIDRHVIARQEAMNQTVEQQMKAMETRIKNLEEMSENKLEALRRSMISSLQDMQKASQQSMLEMRQENAQKLEEIRGTVDEKLQDTLQKRIADSFQTVSQQLEQVYKGLGEMQHLASDVGGLKQVLSGVKTRGILGEIQLGAILEEILSPEQYDTNVATIPGSRERVEFAVKLPGNDGSPVYLPIDSKFPGDTYAHLQEAMAGGDTAAIQEARKALETVLKKSAKDIRDKYVEPPYTTSFGIMFLPFEGLYAEVVNMGMIETLQRDYGINVAGPSTMAALLNSLQMGFRTLAIQKRSNEVWQVLGAVKTEFGKFEDVMLKMQGHLQQTSNDLETLMGTRTRAINRKLKSVQELDETSTQQLLGDSDT
jgi:DNA recombination protein RmuC